ncbi:MAG: DUF1501 domain-containing protein [bacterium]|nr:DUF1501 domain-containing protein [bacterium]
MFQRMLDFFSAIAAFFEDMKQNATNECYTFVFMTEFGRRVTANTNAGLDHGAGSLMGVFGPPDDGNVIGGRVYTLQPDEMTPGWLGMAAQSSPHPNGGPSFNVTGTCDYRRVLGEIVEKRLGLSTTQIGSQVFPGFAYGMTPTTMPLGLFL